MEQGNLVNAAQRAEEAIEHQYTEALKYINEINRDDQSILKHEGSAAYWKSHESYTTGHWSSVGDGGGFWTSTHYTDKSAVRNFNRAEQEIQSLESDRSKAEKKLTALDPSFKALIQTLNNLMSIVNNMTINGQDKDGLAQQDLVKVQKLLVNLMHAFVQKLKADMYSKEMEAGNLSDQELDQLASKIMQYQTGEESDLNHMVSSMTTMINDLQNDYDKAKIDHASYNVLDDWFGSGDAKKKRDDEIMANDRTMINDLLGVMDNVMGEIASLMPELTEAMDVVNEVMKKIESILDDSKLSVNEKRKEVMSLVMFLLSFFEVIKQDVESKKLKNKKDMSQGNIEASKANINSIMTNQKVKEEEEKNAKIDKNVMIATEVIGGALMMMAAPGMGTAMIVAMITAMQVMQTEGVVNFSSQMSKALGSKIGAELFITGIEMLATAGGGAALDAALENAVKATAQDATQAAMQSVEASIDAAAQEAAVAAGKAGDQTAIADAKATIEKAVQQAVDKAAKGVSQQFMKQSFATLVEETVSGAAKQVFSEAIENAAKEAAEDTIEQLATIAKLAARGVETSNQIVDEITTKTANEAVAKASGKEIAEVASDAENSKLDVAQSRARWSFLYGLSSNHVMTQMTHAKKYEGLEDFLEIMQSLMQVMALMIGGGMLNMSTFQESAGNGSLFKITEALSLVPQAGQTGERYQTYHVDKQLSKVVTALQMDGSIADLLHSFIEQLQKNDGGLRDFIRQAQESQATNQSLAAHINDGELAAIQILVSAAG